MELAFDQGRDWSQGEVLLGFLRFYAEKYNSEMAIDISQKFYGRIFEEEGIYGDPLWTLDDLDDFEDLD